VEKGEEVFERRTPEGAGEEGSGVFSRNKDRRTPVLVLGLPLAASLEMPFRLTEEEGVEVDEVYEGDLGVVEDEEEEGNEEGRGVEVELCEEEEEEEGVVTFVSGGESGGGGPLRR
jgi:hypothetical protein